MSAPATRIADRAIAAYRQQVASSWLDLNKRDRLVLEAELDRTLGEIPDGADPAEELGSAQSLAAEMRRAAGLPVRVSWRHRLRQSSWRFKVGLGLTVITSVPLIWYVRTVASYELLPGAVTVQNGVVIESVGSVDEMRYERLPGQPFRFGVGVFNPGPYMVEITGIRQNSPVPSKFVVDRIRVSPPTTADRDPWRDSTPFSPFTLRPYDERTIWITGHFSAYPEPTTWSLGYYPGSKTSVDSWPIQFRVLGLPRHQDLPLPIDFALIDTQAGFTICRDRL